MKITTGLRPEVQRMTLPRTLQGRSITFRTLDAETTAPVPHNLGAEVWVLRLLTPEDTAEHPAGTIHSTLLLPKEPTVKKWGVLLPLFDDLPAWLAEAHEEAMREKHRWPDDAVVTHSPHYGGRVTERRIAWWEVEA